MWNRVRNISRSDLLTDKPKGKLDRIPLVITHNTGLDPLLKNIKRDWNVLKSDEDLKLLFESPMVIARRQPPNIRSMLVRSRLPTPTPSPLATTPAARIDARYVITWIEVHRFPLKGKFFIRVLSIVTVLMLYIS